MLKSYLSLRIFSRLFFSLLLILTFSTTVNAQDDSYLKEFPSVSKVMEVIKAEDALHTSSKQAAVFNILRNMIRSGDITGKYLIDEPSKNEAALMEAYNKAFGKVKNDYAMIDPEAIASLEWNRLEIDYSADDNLMNEIVNKLLGPEGKKSYLELKEIEEEERKIKEEEGNVAFEKEQKIIAQQTASNDAKLEKGTPIAIIGAIIILISLYMFYAGYKKSKQLNEYEFNNKTDGGVVKFPTYQDSVKHERAVAWISIKVKIAFLVLIIGIFVIIMGLADVIDYFD